jgi:uncharacterized protein YxeA
MNFSPKKIIIFLISILIVVYLGGYLFKNFLSKKNNTKSDIKTEAVDLLTATSSIEISAE